jgi:cell wall-associated NlpC family hydrolase
MKWISIFLLTIIICACHSTAKYRAVKKSRSSNNQSYLRKNNQLYDYIQDWIGVPYKYGGMNNRGIDCSGFTSVVYEELYDLKLPRTALDQYNSGKRIRINQLNEGDLVFFRGVRGVGIDHVGIYLEDGNFVHASTSIGVTISDLSEEYYESRFVGACRY